MSPRPGTPLVHPDLLANLGLAGWFDQQVTIEENTPTVNADREPIAGWAAATDLSSVPARVAPAPQRGGSGEVRTRDGRYVNASHIIVLDRHDNGTITEAMRAIDQAGTVYDIELVNRDAEAATVWLYVNRVTG